MFRQPLQTAAAWSRPDMHRVADGIVSSLRQFSTARRLCAPPADNNSNNNDGAGAAVRPRPKDGEVARFELMSLEQVKAELARGTFKPNCALVALDFFVRHGVLTRDNEPHLDEIVRRMHRRMPFPGPHQLEAPVAAAAAAPPELS